MMTHAPKPAPADDVAAHSLHAAAQAMRAQIGRRIIGQAETIDNLLVTLFAGGHALFVGVPGLAKTLLVHTVAQAMGLSFSRIQFTPDLMPSDITGTQIIDERAGGARNFHFREGPLFANLVLADEINRTPPKTQAALLESMQEGAVTSDGTRHPLGPPFHVFATQNPLEQEGTYPLPEAQLDRFMMMLQVGYPSFDEEMEVVRRTPEAAAVEIEPQLAQDQLIAHQQLVRRVPISEALLRRAVSLVRRTRPHDPGAPPVVRTHIAYGAGPRAAQALVMAARARSVVHGRFAVDEADIVALAAPVLRHRLVLSYQGEAEGAAVGPLIDAVLAGTP